MTFYDGLFTKSKVTRLEKRVKIISFLYSFHVAGGERKHVSTGLLKPLLTLRDFWTQNSTFTGSKIER